MMPWHKKRTWSVVPVESPEALADCLIGRSWCLCQGWSLGRYLFLNDQTHEDGAFEVAVCKRPTPEWGIWFQIESITFGWFLERPIGGWEPGDYARDRLAAVKRAEGVIRNLVSGVMDPGQPGNVAWQADEPHVQTPEEHGYCGHCR